MTGHQPLRYMGVPCDTDPLVSEGRQMTGLIGKGAGVCGTDPLRTKQNEHCDFATDSLGSKAFQTMRARAALAGFSLFEAGSGFLLCRHDMTVAAPCLRCVGDVLRRVGGLT